MIVVRDSDILQAERILFLHMTENGALDKKEERIIQFSYAVFETAIMKKWNVQKKSFVQSRDSILSQALISHTFDIKGTLFVDPSQPTLTAKGDGIIDIKYLKKNGMPIQKMFYYFLMTLKQYIFNYSSKCPEFLVCGHNIQLICKKLLFLYTKIGEKGISHYKQKSFKNFIEIQEDQNMLSSLLDHLLEAPKIKTDLVYRKEYQYLAPTDLNWEVIQSDGKHNIPMISILFAYFLQKLNQKKKKKKEKKKKN